MDEMLSKPYTLEECARTVRRFSARTAPRKDSPPRAEPLASVDAAAVAGLRRLRGDGHGDLYSKLVELFEASSTESLAQLARALESSELAAAAAACHKLASSAANVGAGAFARDVRQLERLCKAGDTPGARELNQRLAAAHPALIAELAAMRLRASA